MPVVSFCVGWVAVFWGGGGGGGSGRLCEWPELRLGIAKKPLFHYPTLFKSEHSLSAILVENDQILTLLGKK